MSFLGGMPLGFADLLRRKYDVQQQNADTARLSAAADANLANVRAGLLPGESEANIGLTNAQAGLAGANMRNVDETTKTIAPESRARISLMGSQGRNLDASAGLTKEQTVGESQMNRMSRFSLGATNPYAEAVNRFFRFGL